MLLNLKALYVPATLEEAISLLAEPHTYPLYGGVALQRAASPNVEAAVKLDHLGLNTIRDSENSLHLGSMLTLEQVRQACQERSEYPRLGALATVLAEEMPEALRNAMTLGDLLMERNPQSFTLTLLLALGGIIKRIDMDMHVTLTAWFSMSGDVARYLIAQVHLLCGSQHAVVAHEKVSRTPTDAPIVGAVACAEIQAEGQPRYTTLALCGVAPTPIPQPEVTRILDETGDLGAALNQLTLDPPSDPLGSREYRTEMARVLSRRVLEQVIEKLK